jgi:hypothetical protein
LGDFFLTKNSAKGRKMRPKALKRRNFAQSGHTDCSVPKQSSAATSFARYASGLPDGIFSNQKSQFGLIFEGP